MTLTVTRLTPCFAARIDGVDITRPLDEPTWADIRSAFEEHSVLVFRGQPMDDDTHIVFSCRFGSREVTRSINPAAGTPFARQSTLGISLCSLLSALIVPPEGGATEFASTRCAHAALPEALKRRVETAIAVHDFSWSRDQIRPGSFTEKERAEYPPVRHPVVRTNPVNGHKALFLGAHASHIVGMPVDDGRALLKELLDHATQPQVCYRHEWREGDLVVWDNRCVLHRATPYDTMRYKRPCSGRRCPAIQLSSRTSAALTDVHPEAVMARILCNDTDQVTAEALTVFPELESDIRLARPVLYEITEGSLHRCPGGPLPDMRTEVVVTNAVGQQFGHVVTLGDGAVWAIPKLDDTVK